MRTLTIDGVELVYDEHGDTGDPALVLLHGMGGCAGDWVHAGRERLGVGRRLIALDARGHGRSGGVPVSHRRLAGDLIAVLDHLGLERVQAIGMSMGGNTLLHAATAHPARFEAMVVISATLRFPEQARAIMRQVPAPEAQPEAAWAQMRNAHGRGDDQIAAIWRAQRALADSHDDLCFTADDLARIRARTLVIYGDRDPLYPVEMAVETYRGIPDAALWVVPGGGHGPVFLDAAERFAITARGFLG